MINCKFSLFQALLLRKNFFNIIFLFGKNFGNLTSYYELKIMPLKALNRITEVKDTKKIILQ